MLWLVLAHLATTLMMTGVIWLVQVVQYPLFAHVGSEAFGEYHAGHTALITWVVLPLMVVEASTAGLLLLRRPDPWPAWLPAAGFALVLVVWATTFFHSVPRHGALAEGFDAVAHAELVAGNWVRTAGWSLRSALALYGLSRLMG